ncbi:membrane-spanning 4-domains subfamily A member 4A-like [Periophthalmus magnuspinnatus]|uniref:membrane-spanning 4-domains subfamily A member 4A-like n=1 Tax=Periophthalmus magnuspinnatus TaxID=409849 RepID=UPI00145BC44C|nr:membrane-spanning 4-domains subfamily A member 4A-like [Periophthalmus magnuspinnatus]
MAEVALVDPDTGLSDSPLVSVSFQRNEQRKLKFLEGEPKALGITQILLIFFHMSCIATLTASGLGKELAIPHFVASVFIFIAGSVAIAAKNLHLPTLRACLGMEIFSSVACLVNLIVSLLQMESRHSCYYVSDEDRPYCLNAESANAHLFAELVVIQVALFAISITLAVYACKVVNCCSPAPKVPVIMIQAPPAPQ